LLQTLLTLHDASVETAKSATEGLLAIKKFRPDVLLSDIAMPNIDGDEFIRAVRQLPPDERGTILAIAISAHGRVEDRERSATAGYDDYFVKPSDIDALIATIVRLSKDRSEAAAVSQYKAWSDSHG
jgi:CheY-like chemotaxis protein